MLEGSCNKHENSLTKNNIKHKNNLITKILIMLHKIQNGKIINISQMYLYRIEAVILFHKMDADTLIKY